MAAAARRVLQAADRKEAERYRAEFVERFGKTAPQAVKCLENAFEDALAVLALPEKYRKRLRSTNLQERLNEEIRRRERVIRIFPNDASALRLISALLAEHNEAWLERRIWTWTSSTSGPWPVRLPTTGLSWRAENQWPSTEPRQAFTANFGLDRYFDLSTPETDGIRAGSATNIANYTSYWSENLSHCFL